MLNEDKEEHAAAAAPEGSAPAEAAAAAAPESSAPSMAP